MRNQIVRPVMLFALVAMSAPAFAQKVNVDWDRTYLGPWETYAWVAPKAAADNPLAHQRIVNAINYWLTMRGRQEVKENENPNVVLTYHTSSKDEVVVTADSYGYGYGPGFYWGGGMGGMTTTTARSHTYTKGTLAVDVWEPKEKKLLFRGTCTDTVDANPEKMEKKINKCVEKMVKEFDKKVEKENKKKAT